MWSVIWPFIILFIIWMAVWLMAKARREPTSYQQAKANGTLPTEDDQGWQTSWSLQGIDVDAYGNPSHAPTGMMIEGEPVDPEKDENGFYWFKGRYSGKYWSSQEVAKMMGMPIPPRRY